MNAFLSLLNESTEYNEAKKALERGRTPVSITGVSDSEKCHFVAELFKDTRVRVIVTYNEIRAREIFDDLKLFDANPVIYPAKDLIFYQADIKGNLIARDRMMAIEEFLSGKPVTVIMSADALVDKILPLKRLTENIVKIKSGETIDITDLSEKLVANGFERTAKVSAPGEFAVRGGIIDIFPLNHANPVRIELFGDEVDSIRTFDAESQRSIENKDEVIIFPASEFTLTNEEMEEGFNRILKETEKTAALFRKDKNPEAAARLEHVSTEAIETIEYMRGKASIDSYITSFYGEHACILDYFDPETPVIFDEPVRIFEELNAVITEFTESMTHRIAEGYMLPSQSDVIINKDIVFYKAAKHKLFAISALEYGLSNISAKEKIAISVKPVNAYTADILMLVKDVESYKKRNYKTLIVTGSSARAMRLTEELNDYDINAVFSDTKDREVSRGEVVIFYGTLKKGFEYPGLKTVVLTVGETGRSGKARHRKTSVKSENRIHSLNELSYGDYVVHEREGLGIYRGIEKRDTDKTHSDYIKIEYGDGELYIPATNLECIQKYASHDADKKPKINKINSPEWRKTKERVRKSVSDIAEKLVMLYAERLNKQGFKYSPDTVWQTEFEESFPYDETDDQLKAIEDTKHDMESGKVMDRLICGDVGFGKTEVAIRAAFKAVQDGKQVAVLVPTTILAEQHYNTFSARLSAYPVRVELLSRFRTPSEQKASIKALTDGSADIVIGTHRILSKDVTFKDLGLLIVDEEQRFGVAHKERIKELKKDIDVLTLSATPIPRTLHMSLSGIRDMSVLNEAPIDRLPIQTFVMEHNDEIIREAVNREIARSGQVYYVSNRVNGIEEKAHRIQELCPDVTVRFAHGQMSERELEKIMYSFIGGEIDVLVSTTIIETGLDIPNVNTIIIDDADRFGLSQLYQLRGRVGRSARTSYAFLMYKRGQILKEVAEKRLTAIREYTDLGSGYKIAMRDLEIRGAGSVLGAEQSGHMEEVGYELYCKMLDTALKEAKGEEVIPTDFDTVIKLPLNAYIPESYIANEAEKLDMYKRIAMINTDEDKLDAVDEMTDRYGEIPDEVWELLTVAQLKAMCHKVFVTKLALIPAVSANETRFKLSLFPNAAFKNELIDEFFGNHKEAKLTFGSENYIVLTIREGVANAHTKRKLPTEQLKTFLTSLREIVRE